MFDPKTNWDLGILLLFLLEPPGEWGLTFMLLNEEMSSLKVEPLTDRYAFDPLDESTFSAPSFAGCLSNLKFLNPIFVFGF